MKRASLDSTAQRIDVLLTMAKKRKRFSVAGSPTVTSAGVTAHKPADLPPPPAAGCELGSLAWEDVQVATNVLKCLADRPDIFAAKALRGLRAALRPLVLAQLRRYEPVDYSARVSAALLGKRWHEALRALDGLRDLGEPAKAGTVQRWVRQCDGCPQHLHARLLGAVLLSARPSEVHVDGGSLDTWGESMAQELQDQEMPQCIGELTEPRKVSESGKAGPEHASTLTVSDGDIRGASPAVDHESLCERSDRQPGHEDGAPACAAGATSGSISHRVLFIEPAEDRQPPNLFDLHINASAPHAVAFCSTPPPVARRPVPGVPGACVLDNVLTQEECAAILTLARSMGFRADHPVSSPVPSPTYAVLNAPPASRLLCERRCIWSPSVRHRTHPLRPCLDAVRTGAHASGSSMRLCWGLCGSAPLHTFLHEWDKLYS